VNQLQQIFQYQEHQVRTVIKDGEPWFAAKDVCEILDISKHRDAVSRLDNDERGSVLVDTPGGTQSLSAVNEFGLYSLILRSRKPEAKQFKRWVTHEVIPTIRKTGSYSIKKLDSYMIDDPIERAKRWIEEQEEKLAIQQQLQIASPKAEMYDVALSADNAQTMSIVAKTLGYGRNRLFAFLREQGVLRQNNEPYQEFIDRGYFRIRQVPISRSSGTQNKPQTLVTAKGMDYIAKLLKKHGLLKRAL
jgi:prophage antirepressor-like protein